GDEEAVADGSDGFPEGLGVGREVAGAADLPVAVKDDADEGPDVQVDARVESGGSGGLNGTHGEGLRQGWWMRRRLGAPSSIAEESLHEYPGARADRSRIVSFRGMLFLQRPRQLSLVDYEAVG